MNPYDEALISMHDIMHDSRNPESIRLQAYQQYLAMATASQSTAVPATRTSINNTATSSPFGNSMYTDPDPIPLELLESANGVIYGSRGLRIERSTSDYDFAFSYETHRELYHTLIHKCIPKSESTAYFTSIPESGYHTFFQYKAKSYTSKGIEEFKVDILFVYTDEDLDVIRASVQDLQSIPLYMLYDKHFRIEAYNKALQHRGWKPITMYQRSVPRPREYRDMFSTSQRSSFREARSGVTTGTSSWF